MDILTYSFMQRAFVAGLLVACVCPLIGMFLVIKRQALLGDGLGHIAFAGVTGASLLHVYPPLGAMVLTGLSAMGIELVRRRQSEYTDTILALFFYAGLAMAVIFSTLSKMPSTGLLNFLFGSILTVTDTDLWTMGGVTILVGGVIAFIYDKLVMISFDEEIAHVMGIPVGRTNMIFAVISSFVIVMGMTVVGILLISALMIVPVASAHLWRKGFNTTLRIAVGYSVLSVVGGLVTSFYGDVAPGGTIVMTAIVLYILTFAIQGWRQK